MAKTTKAELEARVQNLEARVQQIRKICLLRATRNDLRGGSDVHAANCYRLVVKMIDDPKEMDRATREVIEWIEKGMRV